MKKAAERLQQIMADMPAAFATTKQNSLVANQLLDILGHATASVVLLEHAVWSIVTERGDSTVDADAFARWVLEEAPPTIETADSAAVTTRVAANYALVFGHETAKL